MALVALSRQKNINRLLVLVMVLILVILVLGYRQYSKKENLRLCWQNKMKPYGKSIASSLNRKKT
jgi:nicotinamide riboside transporter PnuC